MTKRNPQLIQGNNHHALLFNSVLWFCSFTILLLIFSEDNSPKKIDFIYTISFLATIIVPVLLNLYIIYFIHNQKCYHLTKENLIDLNYKKNLKNEISKKQM